MVTSVMIGGECLLEESLTPLRRHQGQGWYQETPDSFHEWKNS